MSGLDPIRTIAVAGGGIVGLSAAIAFARALPGTEVTVVETPRDPAALADRLPTTWPGVAAFHARLGIEEIDLVRAGVATHHLGMIFEGWSAGGEQWVHAFGNYGKPVGAIHFDQVWCRAREQGEALPYDRYSVGAALAGASKFVHPARHPDSLGSRFQFGLRLDPERYRDLLEQQATACGAEVLRSDIGKVERKERGIAALQLTDGRRVEADLFVDCTGPSARLLGALDDSFEDWAKWMPFDRLAFDEKPSRHVPATAGIVRAIGDGWSAEWPLRDRTLRAEVRIGGEGTPIARGRRLRPWVENVLALGDAATALDPLNGMNLDAAQQAILLALELLPGREFDPLETQEYNRRAEQLTRRMRDFLALHYLRSGRTSGVWADFSGCEPPDSLARTLDQYVHRARLPFHEEESVSRDSWTAALLGMGVIPAHADPQALGVPLDKAVPAMRRLAHEIQETVSRLPGYAEYLASMLR